MVSPRQDRWVVSASKPKDVKAFDAAVRQPFQAFSYSLGYGPSQMVYELFMTEEQAIQYSMLVTEHGATDVRISPPRTPPRP